MVRAKFVCEEKTETRWGWRLKFSAITSKDTPENESFWEATPCGSIELQTVNQEAADKFEVGKEYYLDFTPAPVAAE